MLSTQPRVLNRARRWLALAALLAAFVAQAALSPIPGFPLTGRYSLSVDGGGARNATYSVDVDVPSGGATVYKAYLLAATYGGLSLADGDVLLNGNSVSWTSSVSALGGEHHNYLADVTSIVTAAISSEARSSTTTSLTVGEQVVDTDASGIDGTVLVVVFNDPTLTADRMVVLMTGAQATAADSFSVTYPGAIPPNGTADFGVGISRSVQEGSHVTEYTSVNINGTRLTTAAGGQDDGSAAIGALITVGGVGDSNANPTVPTATPTGDPRVDDEAYSLLPIIASTVLASTPVTVATSNPSGDDNLFFAWFVFSAEPVLGETVLLTPNQATNQVGTTHTVTAAVVDADGNPAVGRQGYFTVISGPNADETSELLTTDDGGEVSWTYTDASAAGGTDQIQAIFLDAASEGFLYSNVAIKIWVEGSVEDSQFVPLDPGWNLVFIRVDTFETDPDVLFGPGSYTYLLVKTKASGTTYSYDYSYRRVSGADSFSGGLTYWVYEPGEVSRTVRLDGVTNTITTTAIGRAWNTAGVHSRTTVPAAVGFIAVYSYNAKTNAYEAAAVEQATGRTVFEAERGYFVFAIRPVSFTIRP